MAGVRSPNDNRRYYRIGFRLGYILIAYVVLRRVMYGLETGGLPLSLALLAGFLILYVASPWFERSYRRFQLYLALQVILIETLGLVQPEDDTWAVLYIPLGLQVMRMYPLRQALAWGTAFSILTIVTLIYTTGLISGLGFSLFYIASGIFFVAYDSLYARSEAARDESRELLTELETAHQRLQERSARAEEAATIQEHNRLARELHDSVGQILFSITLNTETASMLLEKDPVKVPERLERLQELTGQALSQMRALISQWRPAEEQGTRG
jgi:signal transduction histidine kinase